jgi:hypothetical protein
MYPTLLAALCCVLTPAQPPVTQSWSDTGLISVDDDWSRVPAIVGHRGDGLAAEPGTDPRTVLADGSATPVDVAANRTDPTAIGLAAGVAEFELADPVVALRGSATASAPHLVFALDTRGHAGVSVRLTLRDIDTSATDAVEPVAVQYRVGAGGHFANVPGGYVADATGGSGRTQVRAALPAAADGKPLVQVRVITTDSVGRDEWFGVDDIEITAATVVGGGCGDPGPQGPPGQAPPPSGPVQNPPAPAPRPPAGDARSAAPRLAELTLTPASFVPARRGPAVLKRGRSGAALRFRLSKAASVRFRIGPGDERRRFVVRGRRGLNRLRFTGRVRGRALANGSYVLTAIAVDGGGRSSAQAATRFRIGR